MSQRIYRIIIYSEIGVILMSSKSLLPLLRDILIFINI